jgi:hypothetical protein
MRMDSVLMGLDVSFYIRSIFLFIRKTVNMSYKKVIESLAYNEIDVSQEVFYLRPRLKTFTGFTESGLKSKLFEDVLSVRKILFVEEVRERLMTA